MLIKAQHLKILKAINNYYKSKRYSPTIRELCAITEIKSTSSMVRYLRMFFDEAWRGEAIRNLGVRVSELTSNDLMQLSLYDSKDMEKQKAADKVIDNLRIRFGKKAVIRACFIDSGISGMLGDVGEEDYPMVSSIL